jgi:geranylgeranyl reductase family protein
MSDVIIVGAGPAGSVLAALLAQRSIDVLLLDRATFPRPKTCGDYLSPGTVHLLARLDLLGAVQAGGARPLWGMAMVSPDGTTLTARYPAAVQRGGARPHALAIPRAILDALLLEHARRWGVKCLEAFRVTDLIREGGRVCGVRGSGPQGPEAYRARVVVGADGRNSVVARRLNLYRPHPRLRRMALVAYYEGASGLGDHGLVSVGDGSYCILNPVGESRISVAIVSEQAVVQAWKGRQDDLFQRKLATFPKAVTALAAMRRTGAVRCLGPLAYRARRTAAAGALLIGDAAGFFDPFTGEGVFHALQSAERAAGCIAQILRCGRPAPPLLARFDREQRRALAARQRLAAALQAILRRPAIANGAARFLLRRPRLADLLMGVIGDLLPPRALLSGNTLKHLLR